jgi:hypothetical protein
MASMIKELLSRLRTDADAAYGDVRAMVVARWELANLELRAAVAQAKHLAVWLVAAIVMVLTALPVLLVALAFYLDRCCQIRPHVFLLWAGLALLVGGGTAALVAWRRFRRECQWFEATLDEMREDVTWVKEWGDTSGEELE